MNATSVGRLLACFCLQGLLSLEDLDRPSPYWLIVESERSKAIDRARHLRVPSAYPPPTAYRNLAREWIAGHKSEWEAMLIKTLNEEATPTPPANPIHGL